MAEENFRASETSLLLIPVYKIFLNADFITSKFLFDSKC